MDNLLKSAIENLAIYTVSLRNARTDVSDGYNSLIINMEQKKSQSFKTVVKIEAIEMAKDSTETPKRYYSFHYEVGSRLVSPATEDGEDAQKEPDAILTIEARFEAIYRAKKELSKEQLEAFAANNVGYNVWPYWREYLQSTCSRIGVTPIKVPFYKTTGSDIPSDKPESHD